MKIRCMVVSVVSAFLLPAISNAQPGNDDFRRPVHGCCCCCSHHSHQDQKPPRRGPGGGSMLTKKLINKLSLTDEQVAKWKEEEKAFQAKMEAARPDKDSQQQLSREEMKEKMDTMMKEREASIQSILSEEQYKLYQEYMKENRPKRPEGAPEGGFGPGGPGGFGGPDEEF